MIRLASGPVLLDDDGDGLSGLHGRYSLSSWLMGSGDDDGGGLSGLDVGLDLHGFFLRSG